MKVFVPSMMPLIVLRLVINVAALILGLVAFKLKLVSASRTTLGHFVSM